jgi:hypothetical protein
VVGVRPTATKSATNFIDRLGQRRISSKGS